MMSFFFIIELFFTYVESFLCFQFLDIFIEIKDDKKLFKKVLGSALITATGMFFSLSEISIATTLFVIIAASMGTYYLFHLNLSETISVISFYYMCVYILGYFCLSFVGCMLQDQRFAVSVSFYSINRCIFLTVNTTILLIAYFILKKHLKKYNLTNIGQLFLISALGFASMFPLMQKTFINIDRSMTVNWFLYLLTFLLIFIVFLILAERMNITNTNQIIRERNKLYQDMLKELQGQFIENMTSYHDFNNHIIILLDLLNNDRYTEAQNYLENLGVTIRKSQNWMYTNNPTFNYILNLKKEEAAREHIMFTINAEPIYIHIDDKDITSILFNLFDNSLEACRRIENDIHKFIRIDIRNINQMTIIKISNAIDKEPLKNGHAFITSKDEKKKHGYGLQSVQAAVASYGGNMKTSYDETAFFVTIVFFNHYHSKA